QTSKSWQRMPLKINVRQRIRNFHLFLNLRKSFEMHIKGFKIELNKFLSISVSLTNIHHFKSMNGKAFLYEVLPYFFLHVHYFEEIRVMIIDFFLQNLNGSEYFACSTSDKFVIKWYSAYKGR